MAIDTTHSDEFEYPGEEDVGAPPRRPRPGAARNGCGPTCCGPSPAVSSATCIGHWLGNVIASGYVQAAGAAGQNDVAIVLGLSFGVVGWMAGIGGLHLPAGQDPRPRASPLRPPRDNWVRYFRMTDDHKVVGWQYAVGVLLFLFTGGLLAMLIRTELLSPTNHVFGPGHLHRDRG